MVFSIQYQSIGQTHIYEFNIVEEKNVNVMSPPPPERNGVADELRGEE